MTTMTTTDKGTILSDELLEGFAKRAPAYDRENRFFMEDWEEIKASGFLRLNIPEEFGGLGMNILEVSQELQRLAYRAPETALAVNMHLYWTGIAAELRKMGDNSLDWMLQEAAAGEVFAAGHAETGNDLPGMLSTSKAE